MSFSETSSGDRFFAFFTQNHSNAKCVYASTYVQPVCDLSVQTGLLLEALCRLTSLGSYITEQCPVPLVTFAVLQPFLQADINNSRKTTKGISFPPRLSVSLHSMWTLSSQ